MFWRDEEAAQIVVALRFVNKINWETRIPNIFRELTINNK